MACPVHAVLPSFIYTFRRLVIENYHTVVGFLPVNNAISKAVQRDVIESERSSKYCFT